MPLLNESQLSFCQATDQYIRLLAPAGSGKTLFGSVLREDFSPEGDVDIHISFPLEFNHTWAEWLDMIDELKVIFQREVDLVLRSALERSDNPYRKHHILTHWGRLYGA